MLLILSPQIVNGDGGVSMAAAFSGFNVEAPRLEDEGAKAPTEVKDKSKAAADSRTIVKDSLWCR